MTDISDHVEISRRQEGDTSVYTIKILERMFNNDFYGGLREQILAQIVDDQSGSNKRRIDIDLDKVEYMDNTGGGVLIGLYNIYSGADTSSIPSNNPTYEKPRAINCSKPLSNLLVHLMRLNLFVEIYHKDAEQEAETQQHC